jgi:hypothetical protein
MLQVGSEETDGQGELERLEHPIPLGAMEGMDSISS